ncbi:ferredoxin [Wansuia hejianensis]|uniref:Ferredoxin n=1 Tax=Wansuia hejianensis TaxID=2763667 RepID=A0A926EXY9_9FIRM|nr:ferredoxin [Wansuia hejianensis]MBC8589607.1 ferredoxin [Wansuia hejianensis]
MKAHIDKDACIGCGLCTSICSEVFEMGDDDIAVVIADPVPAEAKENAREAADSCPTEAISIEE